MIDDLLTEDAAAQLLGPHRSLLLECIEGGWQDWKSALATTPSLAVASKRARANIVYDFITARAEERFAGVEGVTISRKRGFLQIALLGANVVIRFKKFRSNRLDTSGIPTEQRLEIEAQQATFDGMSVTHLTAGYLPDALGDELEVTALSCSYGGDLQWSLDLLDGTADIAAVRSEDAERPAVRSTHVPAKTEQVSEGS